MRTLAILALALLHTGCAEDDAAPGCPGPSTPLELTLADVSPEPGTSVSNDAIVHTFTLTGSVAFDSIAFAFPEAHTAGEPTPELGFEFEQTDAGTVYTAEPVSWEVAPGHVELAVPVIYQTPDGCGYELPSPLFAYDVTPP